MADGWRLNLYQPGWEAIGWPDFPHREAVLQWFREQVWRNDLAWEVEEFADGGTRWMNWVYSQSGAGWLCFEAPEGGSLEVI